MIIADYNKMTIEELKTINKFCCKEYIIEGGMITGTIRKENKHEQKKAGR